MEHRNLQNLREAIERQTRKKTTAHLLTRSNGRKLLEIIIGADNPLSSLAIHMEEPFLDYWKDWDKHVLFGTMAIYEKYKSLEKVIFKFNGSRDCLRLRLINYEKNIHYLKNLPYWRFLDLAFVPVLALTETIGESSFSIMGNIQIGKCQNCTKELFQAAYENEKNDCMVEAIEFSAEELGFETFLMSNSLHCATINRLSLESFAIETQNERLFLIPANVHEILIIPEDNIYDVTELKDFSQQIIESLDTEDVFLSNNIYRYNRKTDSLAIIPFR